MIRGYKPGVNRKNNHRGAVYNGLVLRARVWGTGSDRPIFSFPYRKGGKIVLGILPFRSTKGLEKKKEKNAGGHRQQGVIHDEELGNTQTIADKRRHSKKINRALKVERSRNWNNDGLCLEGVSNRWTFQSQGGKEGVHRPVELHVVSGRARRSKRVAKILRCMELGGVFGLLIWRRPRKRTHISGKDKSLLGLYLIYSQRR